MQKIIVSPIKGGAILFTTKVVVNLLFVVRETTGYMKFPMICHKSGEMT